MREIFYEFVATRLGNIFSNIVYSIFCELLLRYLFYLDKNTPFDMHSLKVNLNGLQMDFPQIFNIRMLHYVLYLDLIFMLFQIYRYLRSYGDIMLSLK